jgi:hypothetical protein
MMTMQPLRSVKRGRSNVFYLWKNGSSIQKEYRKIQKNAMQLFLLFTNGGIAAGGAKRPNRNFGTRNY